MKSILIKVKVKTIFLTAALIAVLFSLGSCSFIFLKDKNPDVNTGSALPPQTERPALTETAEETISEKEMTASFIKNKIASMTIEEKVGQLFLARCPDTVEEATAAVSQYKLGGYVLFANHFKDRNADEVKSFFGSCQGAAAIPLFIAADEEGGTVNRVSRFTQFRASSFLSPREIYASGGLDAVKEDTAEKAQLLLSLGINLNLAPVCDISTDPADFIYDRSVGLDAAGTSDYVRAVVSVMNEYGIGCSLKHFPGYGSNADTHYNVVYDERPYDTFKNADFLPFIAGIDAGAGSVMVSHNIMTCVDGTCPASISAKVHDILRTTLKYDGVIMTDDLAMEGITDFTNGSDAAVTAVLAGNDILCTSDFEAQYSAVLQAVTDGTITEARIDESLTRILRWKIELGLLEIK